ncbi:sensor histidine kinase [Nocardioides fonticola]
METDPARATAQAAAAERGAAGRIGPLFATIWLFYLGDPIHHAWQHRDQVAGVVGGVATVAFAAVYMTLWMRIRSDRTRLVRHPPASFSVPYLVALLGLGTTMVATLGESGMASVVYIAVATVIAVPARVSLPIVGVVTVAVLALGAVEDWGSQASLAFGVVAAAAAMFGMRAVMSRNLALVAAEQENARLAVEHERTRFARDLHDILGHSLTVITVKAELAGRLLEQDSPEARERARREVADLERLSRDALADVRRAVAGYRDLSLPGELARARMALEAAQIDAELPNSTDEVPSDLRELFAWTVREGVTNVIRHSGARRCRIDLDADRVRVSDDGAGPEPAADAGSGLAGLRERAAAVGATVVTRALEPGFALEVQRS